MTRTNSGFSDRKYAPNRRLRRLAGRVHRRIEALRLNGLADPALVEKFLAIALEVTPRQTYLQRNHINRYATRVTNEVLGQ